MLVNCSPQLAKTPSETPTSLALINVRRPLRPPYRNCLPAPRRPPPVRDRLDQTSADLGADLAKPAQRRAGKNVGARNEIRRLTEPVPPRGRNRPCLNLRCLFRVLLVIRGLWGGCRPRPQNKGDAAICLVGGAYGPLWAPLISFFYFWNVQIPSKVGQVSRHF